MKGVNEFLLFIFTQGFKPHLLMAMYNRTEAGSRLSTRFRDLDEQHPPVGRVWGSSDITPPFKRIEQACHGCPRNNQPICNFIWGEWGGSIR